MALIFLSPPENADSNNSSCGHCHDESVVGEVHDDNRFWIFDFPGHEGMTVMYLVILSVPGSASYTWPKVNAILRVLSFKMVVTV